MKPLLAVLLLVAAVVAIGPAFLDSTWNVTRQVEIGAPPAQVAPLVADLKRWQEWVSWSGPNDAATVTYEGPAAGPGAKMAWQARMTKGALTVTAADPERGVEFDLAFEGGAVTGKGAIALEPTPAGGTRVTWSDSGDLGDVYFRRIQTVMMDSTLGGAFAANLARLKDLVEPP